MSVEKLGEEQGVLKQTASASNMTATNIYRRVKVEDHGGLKPEPLNYANCTNKDSKQTALIPCGNVIMFRICTATSIFNHTVFTVCLILRVFIKFSSF